MHNRGVKQNAGQGHSQAAHPTSTYPQSWSTNQQLVVPRIRTARKRLIHTEPSAGSRVAPFGGQVATVPIANTLALLSSTAQVPRAPIDVASRHTQLGPCTCVWSDLLLQAIELETKGVATCAGKLEQQKWLR